MKKIFDFIKNKKTLVVCAIAVLVAIVAVLVLGWVGLWYELLVIGMVAIALSDIKKHSVLKILSIILLLLVLVSYILPGRDGIEQIGIADILTNYFSIVLQNFSYIVLYILSMMIVI